MRNFKSIIAVLLICLAANANAQIFKKLGKKAERAAERALERKVAEKTRRTTESAFDSVFNNKGKIFTQNKQQPAANYSFTHNYEMDVVIKNDTTHLAYFLSNKEEFMASVSNIKENERMTTLLDIPRKTVYNFMERGDTKSMMSIGIDLEKMASNKSEQNEIQIKATGNSKNILGYQCEEFYVVGDDFEGDIWVTREVDISFSDAFANIEKGNKSKGLTQNWMSMANGLTLAADIWDTSKQKPVRIRMLCTHIGETDFTISPSDYKQSF
ncbi:MAG: DUF4412 domain-containing protein [Flavobacteriaceae bacterium]